MEGREAKRCSAIQAIRRVMMMMMEMQAGCGDGDGDGTLKENGSVHVYHFVAFERFWCDYWPCPVSNAGLDRLSALTVSNSLPLPLALASHGIAWHASRRRGHRGRGRERENFKKSSMLS